MHRRITQIQRNRVITVFTPNVPDFFFHQVERFFPANGLETILGSTDRRAQAIGVSMNVL